MRYASRQFPLRTMMASQPHTFQRGHQSYILVPNPSNVRETYLSAVPVGSYCYCRSVLKAAEDAALPLASASVRPISLGLRYHP